MTASLLQKSVSLCLSYLKTKPIPLRTYTITAHSRHATTHIGEDVDCRAENDSATLVKVIADERVELIIPRHRPANNNGAALQRQSVRVVAVVRHHHGHFYGQKGVSVPFTGTLASRGIEFDKRTTQHVAYDHAIETAKRGGKTLTE